jgi:cyanate permease
MASGRRTATGRVTTRLALAATWAAAVASWLAAAALHEWHRELWVWGRFGMLDSIGFWPRYWHRLLGLEFTARWAYRDYSPTVYVLPALRVAAALVIPALLLVRVRGR